jgi:cysteine desulfurase/selenocysteine lyase
MNLPDWQIKARKDFPILNLQVHGKPLVYLDNAATAQKPQQVIDRISKYYSAENANVHRGVYYLSDLASQEYEGARDYITANINARSRTEVIFTRGATEGINLVASSWGRSFLNQNDEVIISGMEHHANMVPWQQICNEKGAALKIIPVTENGELDLDEYERLFTERTKFVSCVWVSNSIGTINPIREIIKKARERDIPVLVDACQAAPHMSIDVQELDCDFLAFSGHKVFGPTGIGVLYGRESWLEKMPPYQTGGDMIKTVTYSHSTWAELPHKFEAGTPHIAGAIGLHEAMWYISEIGRENINTYEHEALMPYMHEKISAIDGLRIIGTAENKIPVVSFVVDGAHPLDIGTFLDFEGVAIRTGNHCTQPLLNEFGVSATCRASMAFYNAPEEIDVFADALKRVIQKVRA